MTEFTAKLTGLFKQLYFLIGNFDLVAAELAVAGGIFLFFLVLRRIFTKYVSKAVLKLCQRTDNHLDSVLLAFEKPLQVFFVFLGAYLALSYLPLSATKNLLVLNLFRSAVIILLAWGFYNLVGTSSLIFKQIQSKFDLQVDTIVIPFVSKIMRFFILFLAFAMVASDWGFEIGGFLAGLGLGGLAFALAAQDTAANFFGGIVIIIDKPFSIGDWIQTSNVEGIVEDISFRSTKVRTFAQALVTVPNATMANQPITNWSRMGKRRITYNLQVSYKTPREKLERCVVRIREMLQNHPEIHQETLFVRFDSFGESSLDIFLYFFTITTNWAEYLRVREDTNFKILQILEEEGVAMALPSRNVYLEKQ